MSKPIKRICPACGTEVPRPAGGARGAVKCPRCGLATDFDRVAPTSPEADAVDPQATLQGQMLLDQLARTDLDRASRLQILVRHLAQHGELPGPAAALWDAFHEKDWLYSGELPLLLEAIPRLAVAARAKFVAQASPANLRAGVYGLIDVSACKPAIVEILSAIIRVLNEDQLCVLLGRDGVSLNRYPDQETCLGQRLGEWLQTLPSNPARFQARLGVLRTSGRIIPEGHDRLAAWREFADALQQFAQACAQKASFLNAQRIEAEKTQAARCLAAKLGKAARGDWYRQFQSPSAAQVFLRQMLAQAGVATETLPADFDAKLAHFQQAGIWELPQHLPTTTRPPAASKASAGATATGSPASPPTAGKGPQGNAAGRSAVGPAAHQPLQPSGQRPAQHASSPAHPQAARPAAKPAGGSSSHAAVRLQPSRLTSWQPPRRADAANRTRRLQVAAIGGIVVGIGGVLVLLGFLGWRSFEPLVSEIIATAAFPNSLPTSGADRESSASSGTDSASGDASAESPDDSTMPAASPTAPNGSDSPPASDPMADGAARNPFSGQPVPWPQNSKPPPEPPGPIPLGGQGDGSWLPGQIPAAANRNAIAGVDDQGAGAVANPLEPSPAGLQTPVPGNSPSPASGSPAPRRVMAEEPLQKFTVDGRRPTSGALCEVSGPGCQIQLHGLERLMPPGAASSPVGPTVTRQDKTVFVWESTPNEQWRPEAASESESTQAAPLASFSLVDGKLTFATYATSDDNRRALQSRLRFCVIEVQDGEVAGGSSRFVALQEPLDKRPLKLSSNEFNTKLDFGRDAELKRLAGEFYLGAGRLLGDLELNGKSVDLKTLRQFPFGQDARRNRPQRSWPLPGIVHDLGLEEWGVTDVRITLAKDGCSLALEWDSEMGKPLTREEQQHLKDLHDRLNALTTSARRFGQHSQAIKALAELQRVALPEVEPSEANAYRNLNPQSLPETVVVPRIVPRVMPGFPAAVDAMRESTYVSARTFLELAETRLIRPARDEEERLKRRSTEGPREAIKGKNFIARALRQMPYVEAYVYRVVKCRNGGSEQEVRVTVLRGPSPPETANAIWRQPRESPDRLAARESAALEK